MSIGYYKANIIGRRRIGRGVIEIRLSKCLSGYLAGQYIKVYVDCNEDKRFREMNLTSIPSDNYLSFAFIYRDTPWKNSIMNASYVLIKGPYGTFVLPDKHSRIAMIALGIGITPFVSMIRYSNVVSMHEITLFYIGEYISYLDELGNKRFKLIICNSNDINSYIKRIKKNIDYFYIAGKVDDVRAVKYTLIRDGIDASIIKTQEFTGY
jgi:Flavodoxin reductases (ferredoxin-NADPH reductases) family 1